MHVHLAETLTAADFVLASGVFNVRLGHEIDAWTAFMQRTIASLRLLAKRGFAFNALTSYADADKQRPDLYYAEPACWFDYCRREISPKVAIAARLSVVRIHGVGADIVTSNKSDLGIHGC